jgi:DNA-binding transcriptional ArsR family regulator
MTVGLKLAEVAALVGNPGRANMLTALLDGRELTAFELARAAGVTATTASGHLRKLTEAGLLVGTSNGRYRFYRLSSPEVASMLEAMMVFAGGRPESQRRASPRIAPALREARTCYDHLAGRVAVAVADALESRGAVVLSPGSAIVTASGRSILESLGIQIFDGKRSRRPLCRACMDWSERRPHLAGLVGAALLDRALALDWVRRSRDRVATITPIGRRAFKDTFGIDA